MRRRLRAEAIDGSTTTVTSADFAAAATGEWATTRSLVELLCLKPFYLTLNGARGLLLPLVQSGYLEKRRNGVHLEWRRVGVPEKKPRSIGHSVADRIRWAAERGQGLRIHAHEVSELAKRFDDPPGTITLLVRLTPDEHARLVEAMSADGDTSIESWAREELLITAETVMDMRFHELRGGAMGSGHVDEAEAPCNSSDADGRLSVATSTPGKPAVAD